MKNGKTKQKNFIIKEITNLTTILMMKTYHFNRLDVQKGLVRVFAEREKES